MIHRIIDFGKHLVGSVMKHNIGVLAAVIAYFGFSSMIPLVLLLIYTASHLIPSSFVNAFVARFVQSYIPTIPNSHDIVLQNLERLEQLSGRISLISILGVLWTTVGGFVSLQYILDKIWGIRRRRSFLRQYVVGLGTLVFLMALTTISAFVTAITPRALALLGQRVEVLEWLSIVHVTARISFPVSLLLTCYFCYRFLPSKALPERLLWLGAVLATAGIYLAHIGFLFYSAHLGRYQLIYGALTIIMLVLFWVYIVSLIVLFCGEVIVALHGFHATTLQSNHVLKWSPTSLTGNEENSSTKRKVRRKSSNRF